MHSLRSLFGYDFVVFEGGQQKHHVEREIEKIGGGSSFTILCRSCTVEAWAVFNMFAITAISSRQTIVNKYLQNNKGVNRNGLRVDDFVVVVCVAGSVVEGCVIHQS
ncbi:hypothetical protein TNCV_2234051 [Trichonephila clavipes]|nr:hypothetical protein TNCV_2234051 [Trichonephila clavipes]